MELNFENVTRSLLRNTTGLSLYDAVNVVNDILALTPPNLGPDYSTHEGRVNAALSSPVVLGFLRESKKIAAIKEVRNITSCGLKEAKEAVEDYRVDVHYDAPY